MEFIKLKEELAAMKLSLALCHFLAMKLKGPMDSVKYVNCSFLLCNWAVSYCVIVPSIWVWGKFLGAYKINSKNLNKKHH